MANLFIRFFREFLDICLFRRAPQDLPASNTLLGLAVLLSACGSLVLARSSLAWPRAAASAFIETLFMLAAVYLILTLQGLTGRWLKTVTAVAGTNAVLIIISLPLLAWLLAAQNQDMNSSLPGLLFLCLIIWNVMVLGHIFRHALSTYFPLGVLVALGYYSLSIMVLNWLVPTTGTAT